MVSVLISGRPFWGKECTEISLPVGHESTGPKVLAYLPPHTLPSLPHDQLPPKKESLLALMPWLFKEPYLYKPRDEYPPSFLPPAPACKIWLTSSNPE